MSEQIYTNYRLQLPEQDLLGTLVVRDGRIADIQPGTVTAGQDGQGDYLLPGLVELHTDNLETCMSPRPKVRWPLEAAAVYHDRDLISAGVTTVCDAIAIGDVEPNSPRLRDYGPMIEVVSQGQAAGRFSADHRIHMRCELGYDKVCEVVEQHLDNPLLSLMSLMDHTPGQRQFVQLDKFKEYYMGKYNLSETDVEDFIQHRIQEQAHHAGKNRQALVQLARDRTIPLASHDDETVEHVQQAAEEAVVIAEFPTTLDAAKEARRHNLNVLMGAPNLILGGSHSGNVSAMELVEQDLVDIIASDYVPQSLLQSIFQIAQTTQKPIYEAMRPVTIHPANTIGLGADRGSLEVGKRADFITIHDDGIVPTLISTFRDGHRVA